MAESSSLGRVFDAYQNLTQVARCIDVSTDLRALDRPPRILELSRRPTGLADFLGHADLVRFPTHTGNEPTLSTPVQLPFADDSFDVCIVTDAYEHIPDTLRQSLLAEMLRTTDGVVLLGCPHDDELVNRFDRIAFDFIWGKYAESFAPLGQHHDYGLESVGAIEKRLVELGASSVAALPCNYVYRWIHQMLIYFDLQHVHPIADLFDGVNRVYNEYLSPYDYAEPCYRYLVVVPTNPMISIDALTARMQAPVEMPAAVQAAEGVLIEAFRAADSRASDLLRDYVAEVDAAHEELDRLRSENARLEGIVAGVQKDNRWALNEIERLRGPRVHVARTGEHRDLSSDELNARRDELAGQRWTAHNVKLADGLLTMPGQPEFFETDSRLAAVRRAIRGMVGDDMSALRIADLGCLEGGFAAALALDGATVVGIEARTANIEKADLLRRHFGLTNLTLEQADVKDFTLERFGSFDVVLALGIAYHLDRPAAWLAQVARATSSLLIVDSHVAPADDDQLAKMRADLRELSPLELELTGDRAYLGRWYVEFDKGISDEARGEQLWASWSNHRSFWLTEESLLRVLTDAGFAMVIQQHDATVGAYDYYRTQFSRGMYVAARERARGVM
jgi:hypothetical protein